MASQVARTTVFRFELGALQPPTFRARLAQLLQRFVQSPAYVGAITKELEAAAATG
jgi:hypothetical protein